MPTESPASEGSITTKITQVSAQQWSGPLPSPDALERFDQISPGAAEIIIDEFVKEADHRRKLEDRDQRFQVRYGHVGQALAAFFALGGLALAGVTILNGYPVTGGIIATTMIVGGITAFLRQRGNGRPKNSR